MDKFDTAISLFPAELRCHLQKYKNLCPEEIRLRIGGELSLIISGRVLPVCEKVMEKKDLDYVVERASGASVHAHMDEICQGYLSYNGLRIGLCGTAITKEGRVSGFKNFSSVNIRIPAVFSGEIDGVYKAASGDPGGILIISGPGGGKTTLLRELIRRFSNDGMRVAVADERAEITAVEHGRAFYDLGPNTDFIVGMRKKEAVMLLLRTMNPQMIALDEISRQEDAEAVLECVGCGVNILATAHCGSIKELRRRKLYREILDENIFTQLITVECSGQGREFTHKRLDI